MIYQGALSWSDDVNIVTSPIWNIMKGHYSCNSYLDMMKNIQELDFMNYNKLWLSIKTLKVFQKGTYLSTVLTWQ